MTKRVLKRATIYILSFLSCTLALFSLVVLWPIDEIIPVKTETPIAITNVSILNLEDGTISPNQTVLVKEKRIQFVGHSKNIVLPENAIHIDGTHRFLMPSLWDMHTHIFKITPLLDLPLYIRYGVTNVRDMMSCPKENDPLAACPEDFKRWTQQAISDQLISPRVQGVASWQLNGSGIHKQISGLPEFFGTATPQQARDFVNYYASKVNAIKVYNFIQKESYFALVDEAKKL